VFVSVDQVLEGFGSSTLVEHSFCHTKAEGSNRALFAEPGSQKANKINKKHFHF
jgi:hypothetical protein